MMKMQFSKKAYEQLTDESKAELKPVVCSCVVNGQADDDCELCDGCGQVYEVVLSTSEVAIKDNLRRQGVPIQLN